MNMLTLQKHQFIYSYYKSTSSFKSIPYHFHVTKHELFRVQRNNNATQNSWAVYSSLTLISMLVLCRPKLILNHKGTSPRVCLLTMQCFIVSQRLSRSPTHAQPTWLQSFYGLPLINYVHSLNSTIQMHMEKAACMPLN